MVHAAIGQQECRSPPLLIDQLARHIFVKHLAKRPLALTVTNFHVERKSPGDFSHALIQKRHARFQLVAMAARSTLQKNVVGRGQAVWIICSSRGSAPRVGNGSSKRLAPHSAAVGA